MAEALGGSLEGTARSDGVEASAIHIHSADGSRGFLGDGGLILPSDYRTTEAIGYTRITPASMPPIHGPLRLHAILRRSALNS